jgi:hypothetical protein
MESRVHAASNMDGARNRSRDDGPGSTGPPAGRSLVKAGDETPAGTGEVVAKVGIGGEEGFFLDDAPEDKGQRRNHDETVADGGKGHHVANRENQPSGIDGMAYEAKWPAGNDAAICWQQGEATAQIKAAYLAEGHADKLNHDRSEREEAVRRLFGAHQGGDKNRDAGSEERQRSDRRGARRETNQRKHAHQGRAAKPDPISELATVVELGGEQGDEEEERYAQIRGEVTQPGSRDL